MERLTKRDGEDNKNAFCPSDVKCCGRCSVCDHMDKMMEKLADYEDAEENGTLIHLPCRVGDTVYEVQEVRKRIQPQEIISVNVYRTGEINFGWELKDGKGMYVKPNGFNERDIGKTVFLTREEAEQALKQMGE